LDTQTPMK